MKKNIELKTEFEIYEYESAGYVSTFINEVKDGNAHVVERTVAQMKKRFALDDAQEAALQIALFHFMLMLQGMREDFPMDSLVGMENTVITHILLKEWREICDKHLTDEGMGCVEDDDEDDGMDPRDLLIGFFATCIDKVHDGDQRIYLKDVIDYFDIDESQTEKAKEILDEYMKKMNKCREKPTSPEAVGRLLDVTIRKLILLSDEG